MRESKFVKQNSEKWAQIEQNLKNKNKDFEVLRQAYTEVTDDLSYAKTFYPNRSVRVYLNGLAQAVHQQLYSSKKPLGNSLKHYLLKEVPKIIYLSRWSLLLSFSVLLLSVVIGLFSSAHDAKFAESILGHDYVKMTLENISKGDPFGVYKKDDQLEMFYFIARNNLEVGLKVFLFGLIASYGSLIMMASNGVSLGVFIYFFYTRNLMTEFNVTVWMHGGVEICTLVIETLAGILLGKGLINPGTYSRRQAFSIWGRRAVMVYFSTIPFVLFAAFIEAFLTRHTELPFALKLALIVVSISFMLFYFVWYPLSYFKSKDKNLEFDSEIETANTFKFSANEVYSSNQLINKVTQILRRQLKPILLLVSFLSMVLVMIQYTMLSQAPFQKIIPQTLQFEFINGFKTNLNLAFAETFFQNIGHLLSRDFTSFAILQNSLWVFVLLTFTYHLSSKNLETEAKHLKNAISYLSAFSILIGTLLTLASWWLMILTFLFFPLIIVVLNAKILSVNKVPLLATFKLITGHLLSALLQVLLSMCLVLLLGFLLLVSPFYSYLLSFITFNLHWIFASIQDLTQQLYAFFLHVIFGIGFIYFLLENVLLSISIQEINCAEGLKEQINQVDKTKKVYGIELE